MDLTNILVERLLFHLIVLVCWLNSAIVCIHYQAIEWHVFTMLIV